VNAQVSGDGWRKILKMGAIDRVLRVGVCANICHLTL
jgi:hypothetical protein